MKALLILIVLSSFSFSAVSQTKQVKKNELDSTKKITTIEASCGQCQFKLKTQKGCDLAVRINGKAYFVEGTSIDEHGDAHANDGFCEAIRKAEVQGEIVNNRYVVTYFKLLKQEKKKG
jgi:hypothetical protein